MAEGQTPTRDRRDWLPGPMHPEMEKSLRKLERTSGVYGVAVMPDGHLASQVCVGTVTATVDRLIPQAVGGDIGCGMATLAFDAAVPSLSEDEAASILSGLYERVPILKHRHPPPPLPESLRDVALSTPSLEKRKSRDGRWQLGSVGRGNHFVELQHDENHTLWALVHSGSRAMGPAIRDHHLEQAHIDPNTGIRSVRADSEAGKRYEADVRWARAYARENRRVILQHVVEVVEETLGARRQPETLIEADHNHVQRETHDGQMLWIHRKGAQAAGRGELGIVPGSMGTDTFHVEGKGCTDAFASSSHGAGREMSRSEARRRISSKRLSKETTGVWFDHRLSHRLREEAPGAYKDIHAVMKAQRELTKIVRTLHPLLVFKGA